MENTFVLRQFDQKDLEQVMGINLRCLPENYSPSFYMSIHNRFPATFIVAEENLTVVGYIMCRVETGLSDFKTFGLTRKGHIISLAVLPEYSRRGIGYTLMQEALSAMTQYNAKECFLEVRTGNKPALNLYEKMQFSIIKTAYGYYADGEDAYKMARRIPGSSQQI